LIDSGLKVRRSNSTVSARFRAILASPKNAVRRANFF